MQCCASCAVVLESEVDMPDSAGVDMPGCEDRRSQLFLTEVGSHVGHSHSHHLHLEIDELELELGHFLVAIVVSCRGAGVQQTGRTLSSWKVTSTVTTIKAHVLRQSFDGSSHLQFAALVSRCNGPPSIVPNRRFRCGVDQHKSGKGCSSHNIKLSSSLNSSANVEVLLNEGHCPYRIESEKEMKLPSDIVALSCRRVRCCASSRDLYGSGL
jgi:hypothetical protein